VSKLARPFVEWVDRMPVIETARLRLRVARTDELPKMVRFLVRNREHLRPWEPRREPVYYTEGYWKGVPQIEQDAARRGQGYRFRLLLPGDESEFIGVIGLRDIVYGSNQFATLGYSMDAAYQGHGYMTEAAQAVVRFGFEQLGLRRIEACSMPANVGSARVLERAGFEQEGLLRSSLMVDGKWEDHILWSVINEHWIWRQQN